MPSRGKKNLALPWAMPAALSLTTMLSLSYCPLPSTAQSGETEESSSLEDIWQDLASSQSKKENAAEEPKKNSKDTGKKTASPKSTKRKNSKKEATGWNDDLSKQPSAQTTEDRQDSAKSVDDLESASSSPAAQETDNEKNSAASLDKADWQDSVDSDDNSRSANKPVEQVEQDSSSERESTLDQEKNTAERLDKNYICMLSHFLESSFVKEESWPGIGPFFPVEQESETSENDGIKRLSDSRKNLLELRTNDNLLTGITLVLSINQKNSAMHLQMSVDFLLESLGASPAKIARFNRGLEMSQKKLLAANGDNFVDISSGPFELRIKSAEKDTESKSKGNYIVSIKSTSPGARTVLSEKPRKQPDKKTAIATEKNVSKDSAPKDAKKIAASKVEQNRFTIYAPPPEDTDEKQDLKTKPASTENTNTELATASDTSVAPATSTGSPNTSSTAPQTQDLQPTPDLLKRQFTHLIQNWQIVKRSAVKNRHSETLTKILGGNALTTQSQAIKFLLDNHKYYEMTPLALEVSGYEPLIPDRKYSVNARIKERQKFIDANTMNVLKDSVQSYSVSYIVEKVHGTWLIIDFKVQSKG